MTTQPLTNIDQLLAAVRENLDTLEQRRNELQAELAELDQERKKYERILRAAEVSTAPAQRANGKKPAKDGKSKVGDQKLEQILAYMKEDPERAVTSLDVADAIGLARTTASVALNVLRDRGQVRLLGKKQREEGDHGQLPFIYKVMPNGDQ